MKIVEWEKRLTNDYDRGFIMHGLVNGFDIVKPHAHLADVYKANHCSATSPDIRPYIEAAIVKEIEVENYVITDTSQS